MSNLKITAGVTSKIVRFAVKNSSVTTGALLSGLVYNSSGLTCYYIREGAATPAVAISLVSATVGTWVSGGFAAVDGTNLPGIYELHLPNAVIATGAHTVTIALQGATNMVPVVLDIELDAVNYQDSVAFGLTSLPSAAAGGIGGLPTVATSGENLTAADYTAIANAIMAFAVESGVSYQVALQKAFAVLNGNLVQTSPTTGVYYALGNPGTVRVTTTLASGGRTNS